MHKKLGLVLLSWAHKDEYKFTFVAPGDTIILLGGNVSQLPLFSEDLRNISSSDELAQLTFQLAAVILNAVKQL